jgi:hypothetical protein
MATSVAPAFHVEKIKEKRKEKIHDSEHRAARLAIRLKTILEDRPTTTPQEPAWIP